MKPYAGHGRSNSATSTEGTMSPTMRHHVPPPPAYRCYHSGPAGWCDKPIFVFEGTWGHRGKATHDHDAEPDPAIAMEAKLDELTEGMSEEDAAVYDC